MFSLKQFIITILIIIALVFVGGRLYYSLTDDFRIGNITYQVPYNADWQIAELNPQEQHQLDAILSQPFTYLGKGSQAYAFKSADGKYVLKFFKFKHIKPPKWLDWLPNVLLKDYKKSFAERKSKLLNKVFGGYRLAYELDKEYSGLIYIQLNISGNSSHPVVVYDKLGLKREIDLRNIPFLVQRYSETLRTVIERDLKEGNIQLAKKHLGQVYDMYAEEYAKGIYDRDHGVMHNTGFVDGQPMHLDVGKMERNQDVRQKIYAKQDALIVAQRMQKWIDSKFPAEAQELNIYIVKKINTLFN